MKHEYTNIHRNLGCLKSKSPANHLTCIVQSTLKSYLKIQWNLEYYNKQHETERFVADSRESTGIRYQRTLCNKLHFSSSFPTEESRNYPQNSGATFHIKTGFRYFRVITDARLLFETTVTGWKFGIREIDVD